MRSNDAGPHDADGGRVPSFVQVSSQVLYSGLAADALHLYLILLDKSWKLGCCRPSNRTIGGWLGKKSPDTVDRIFKKLEARGLVVRTAVPATEANPSGRLITVNGGGPTPPTRKSADGASATEHPSRYARLRHGLMQKEKKENGPLTPGIGAAPEQTPEAAVAELRVMS